MNKYKLYIVFYCNINNERDFETIVSTQKQGSYANEVGKEWLNRYNSEWPDNQLDMESIIDVFQIDSAFDSMNSEFLITLIKEIK